VQLETKYDDMEFIRCLFSFYTEKDLESEKNKLKDSGSCC